MTAKQQSEVREWKEAEERHAQDRITKRNGMDQRMTKVRGKAFRYASSYGASRPGTFFHCLHRDRHNGGTGINGGLLLSSQVVTTPGDGRALAENGATHVRVGGAGGPPDGESFSQATC